METETVAKVNRCSACGDNLSQISVTDYERRTRIDIVFEKRVEYVDAWAGPPRSSNAHAVITSPRASHLPIMLALFQYGLEIKAYILNLLITQMCRSTA